MDPADPGSRWPAADGPWPVAADEFDRLDGLLNDRLDDLLEPDPPAAEPTPLTPAPPALPLVDEALLRAWMERIVARDQRALAALYDATLPRVQGLVLRIVRQPALAAEVVEDTYFQVWRQAVRFDAVRGTVQTWLLGMARSRAIDTLRREARFRADGLDHDTVNALPADGAAADDLLDATRRHADLHQALLRLQAQPRQLVALAFFRGLSHEEIASQTLLPLGTVKSQIRRTLQLLRQWLGDEGQPGVPGGPPANPADPMFTPHQAPTT